MRCYRGVTDERVLAPRREEAKLDVMVGRLGGQNECHFLAADFAGNALQFIVGQDLRVEDHDRGIAAEMLAGEGVDVIQAALALGHRVAGSSTGESH